MKLALFDLDNTLLAGDSDFEWGQRLGESGWVDIALYQQKNEMFYQQYLQRKLDVAHYLDFVKQGINAVPNGQFDDFFQSFLTMIKDNLVLPKALSCIRQHQINGDMVIIISASAEFIVQPISVLFNVEHAIAAQLPTDTSAGNSCLGEDKVRRIKEFLNERSIPLSSLDDACFYSDSINDLPLLSIVGTPIVVDADDALTAIAVDNGWQQISFR